MRNIGDTYRRVAVVGLVGAALIGGCASDSEPEEGGAAATSSDPGVSPEGGAAQWLDDCEGAAAGRHEFTAPRVVLDVANSSISRIDSASGDVLWTAEVADGTSVLTSDTGQPVQIGKYAIVPSGPDEQAIVDTRSGEQVGETMEGYVGGTPSCDLIIAEASGRVSLLEADTGAERWSRQVNTAGWAWGVQGSVLIHTDDGVVALSVDDGTMLWETAAAAAGGELGGATLTGADGDPTEFVDIGTGTPVPVSDVLHRSDWVQLENGSVLTRPSQAEAVVHAWPMDPADGSAPEPAISAHHSGDNLLTDGAAAFLVNDDSGNLVFYSDLTVAGESWFRPGCIGLAVTQNGVVASCGDSAGSVTDSATGEISNGGLVLLDLANGEPIEDIGPLAGVIRGVVDDELLVSDREAVLLDGTQAAQAGSDSQLVLYPDSFDVVGHHSRVVLLQGPDGVSALDLDSGDPLWGPR
ncbi:MAG: PQQ-binding-like beta-propeller repeat protein [bacterium]|nr:PQQ-binding-like beta-propeller repeat protein [bacterium]